MFMDFELNAKSPVLAGQGQLHWADQTLEVEDADELFLPAGSDDTTQTAKGGRELETIGVSGPVSSGRVALARQIGFESADGGIDFDRPERQFCSGGGLEGHPWDGAFAAC